MDEPNEEQQESKSEIIEENIDELNEDGKQVIEIQSKPSIFTYFLAGMVIFGVAFISCVFVFQVVFIQIGVVGISMQPTINLNVTGADNNRNNDTVFCIRTHDVSYKDIVVIDSSAIGDKIIKRVIATAGQTITFKRTGFEYEGISPSKMTYQVLINDEVLVEDYINLATWHFNGRAFRGI